MRSADTRAATVADDAALWAGAIAQAGIDRDAEAGQRRDEEHHQTARFRELVASDGRLFFQRVGAVMAEAATAVNARVGWEALAFHETSTGALLLRATRDGAYVLVAPDLGTDFSNQAGATVTVMLRQNVRCGQRPYTLVMEGPALRMWCDGQALAAGAFARCVVEPWLQHVALGGR